MKNKPEVYQVISDILRQMVGMAKPGVKTIDINDYAENLIAKYKCKSYNRGYMPNWALKPFPTATCINRNHVIAHGIPDQTKIEEGDVVSFDLGIVDKDGNCADAATSIGIGDITNAKRRLLYYAYQAMMTGIWEMKAGVNTQAITRAIESYALQRGYQINKRFAGHRIDKEMHLKPNIYNTAEPSHVWGVLEEGQIYCVEPMVTNGRDNMGKALDDGWGFVTQDGMPSTFFEHMVKITKGGVEILTDHIRPPIL